MKITKGKPIISQVPEIFLLQYDKFGKEVLDEFGDQYQGTNADLPTLLNFWRSDKHKYIKGSNPFFRFAVGNIIYDLSNKTARPITPQESEIALGNESLTSIQPYEDLALVVYPKNKKNKYHQGHLINQAKENKDIDIEEPIIITGLLDVVKDDKFEYGLRFDFNKDGLTIAYNAPVLLKEGYFEPTDPSLMINRLPSEAAYNDLPGRLNRGKRVLINAYESGDIGCRLIRDRINGIFRLNTTCYDLAISHNSGGTHIIKNFSGLSLEEITNYKTRLEELKERQTNVFNKRLKTAEEKIKNINL